MIGSPFDSRDLHRLLGKPRSMPTNYLMTQPGTKVGTFLFCLRQFLEKMKRCLALQERYFLETLRAQPGLEATADILLCLKAVDAQTRAAIELSSAEQSVKHIESLAEIMESREDAIGTFVDVADAIIDVVDDVVEVSQTPNTG